MRARLLLLLACAAAASAQTYTITSVAGGGPGIGVAASSIAVADPYSVAVDARGNIYCANPDAQQVYVFNASGAVIQVIGNGLSGFSGDGGPAASAQLAAPYAVAVDASGNLFIADTNNQRIRKVAVGTGIITTVAGNGVLGFSGDGGAAASAELYYPRGLAIDASGNLFIADSWNQRIRKVAAGSGVITTAAGNGVLGFSGDNAAATSAELNYPWGVAVDSSGNLWIADTYNLRVRKVTAGSGVISTVAGTGVPGFSGDGGPATSAQVSGPYGVAVDNSGNIFIADSDSSNSRIRKVAAGTGIITTVAGTNSLGFSGDGGPATSAQLANASGIAVDASGNLFIADDHNNRIRKVAAGSGIISTVAGNGSLDFGGDGGAASNAQFSDPAGMAVDAAGNLFISDTLNQRIRKVTAGTGIISTVAGNGSAGFSGDGGPATGAQLTNPSGLAVDKSGNLFITDNSNGRIRKVSAGTGIITTVAGAGAPVNANPMLVGALAVDANGNLFFSDSYDGSLKELAANTGSLTTVLPSFTSATSVTGLAADGSGNLFFDGGHEIHKVALATGVITTVAGTGVGGITGDGVAATSAQLWCPCGIASDTSGNFFIADIVGAWIRKVTAATGIINAVAGNSIYGFSGDGGPALAAALANPNEVALDAKGDVFFLDRGNHRIRKLTPAADLSSVSVNPTTVSGGASATGTVTLSFAAPTGGLTVSLWTNGSPAFVPASVTIPAGSTTATFTVTTISTANSSQSTITAFYNGASKTALLTVTPAGSVALSSVSVNPTTVIGSASATGTVMLSAVAPSGGITVSLSTNNSSASAPASVTVAAGSQSASFSVTTHSVAATTSAIITASYSNVSKTATLSITPSTTVAVAISSVSVNPARIVSQASAVGKVTLSAAAPAGGLVVELWTTGTVAFVPAQVKVLAGSTTATFAVTTNYTSSTLKDTITAFYNGVSKTASVTVTP